VVADWLASGRTTKLDDGLRRHDPGQLRARCAFAAQIQVAGRYVAHIYRSLDHYGMGVDSVSEFDARSGTMVRERKRGRLL